MTIIADKIVFGGKSLTKIEGKNVFIPFAIPGEKLDIEITEKNKDYDEAVIKDIIEGSPHRVQPECHYYGKCGGCNMMHIESAYQTELRKQMLCDIFRQNGIDIERKTDVITGPAFSYRARFQFNDGGLSQRKSNVIIPVEECLCAENSINNYLKSTVMEGRPAGRCHIFGSKYLTKSENTEADIIIAKEAAKKTASTPKTKNGKKLKIKENHYFAGTTLSPENTAEVELCGRKLKFDVRGFFQSNLFVFEKVIDLIKQLLPGGQNILDMYSGCGSISAFLTEKYDNVVLVEHNRDALVFAEQNLAGTKHISYGLSGAAWVKNCANTCPQFDACTIDPPRSGMEKEVREWLCASKIPLILSLSCDPATHARDCAELIRHGYEIQKTYLLDFYPNTSHIESLALLCLKN